MEGNSANGFPFNSLMPSQRYQQVFHASQFSSLAGGGLITEITFRPDSSPAGEAFSTVLANVQINLSTTGASPDGLSLTFAGNVGADDTMVHSGPLSLSSADTGPSGGPMDFDILIVFATPFFYDSALGNLLLDIRNFGGGLTTQFDAHELTGDSVSRVFSTTAIGDPAGLTDSIGLVTRFTASPMTVIPDPAMRWCSRSSSPACSYFTAGGPRVDGSVARLCLP